MARHHSIIQWHWQLVRPHGTCDFETSWRWNMNKNHASATLLPVLACNQSTGLFKHFINLPDFRPGRMMIPAEWWYKHHIHWCVCNDLCRTMSSHNLKERLHSPYSLNLISWKNNAHPLRVAYLKLQTRIQEEDVLSGLRWWLAILHPYWLGQYWPLKGERVYKLTTTIWSIHMNTILSSGFSLVFKSTRTFGSILFAAIHHPCLLSIWSRIYIILPLRLTSSAATLSKRCCGFQATAVTGLPRSQQVSLQGVHGLDSVSMCLSVICQV